MTNHNDKFINFYKIILSLDIFGKKQVIIYFYTIL